MKQTEFYLIFDKVDNSYEYICGFKHLVDAKQYIDEFGGRIDTISTLFYKSFDEAKSHKRKVSDVNKNINEFLEMSDELREQFMYENPELVSKLKRLLT